MWQKRSTILAQGAVFSFLTAILLLSKPHVGELNYSHTSIANLRSAASDPSIEELMNRKFEEGKMFAAVAHPLPKRKPSPKPLAQQSTTQVASVTVYKPKHAAIAPEQIQNLITKYAQQYGADPDIMSVIAKCESGFRAEALSPSGAYGGLYQFVSSTWVSNRKAMGLDPDPSLRFNGEEAIRTAAFKMGRDGYGAWPACSAKAFGALALK